MTLNRPQHVGLTAALALLAATATGGLAKGPPDHPVRMSGLRVEGLAGHEVIDRTGAKVGEVVEVETDRKGRTRWIDISLDDGGEARVASFRAFLDARNQRLVLTLSEDLLIARADAPDAEATLPSA